MSLLLPFLLITTLALHSSSPVSSGDERALDGDGQRANLWPPSLADRQDNMRAAGADSSAGLIRGSGGTLERQRCHQSQRHSQSHGHSRVQSGSGRLRRQLKQAGFLQLADKPTRLEGDDEAPAQADGFQLESAQWSERANSLIESAGPSKRSRPATQTGAENEQNIGHQDRSRLHLRHRGVISDKGPAEPSNGKSSCENECNSTTTLPSRWPICASDGQLYGSGCELRRQACRLGARLTKRPLAFCKGKARDWRLKGGPMEEVRVVELRRRCNLVELNRMKLDLLREFNGDVGSMFSYFDANGDSAIEAHELWPRQQGADKANESRLYAQLWDEHSSRCPSRQLGGHKRYRPMEDKRKCWFFLDFAFEPAFEPNPCSLSHLMLFDLEHPSHEFSLETFERAFSRVRAEFEQQASNVSMERQPIRRSTRVHLRLADSRSLPCYSQPAASADDRDSSQESNRIEGDHLSREAKCYWTRYNLNLAGLQDPHVSVIEPSAQTGAGDLVLSLNDAQLYLSGQYRCICHLKNIARNFEHTYTVQVSGKPW